MIFYFDKITKNGFTLQEVQISIETLSYLCNFFKNNIDSYEIKYDNETDKIHKSHHDTHKGFLFDWKFPKKDNVFQCFSLFPFLNLTCCDDEFPPSPPLHYSDKESAHLYLFVPCKKTIYVIGIPHMKYSLKEELIKKLLENCTENCTEN